MNFPDYIRNVEVDKLHVEIKPHIPSIAGRLIDIYYQGQWISRYVSILPQKHFEVPLAILCARLSYLFVFKYENEALRCTANLMIGGVALLGDNDDNQIPVLEP